MASRVRRGTLAVAAAALYAAAASLTLPLTGAATVAVTVPVTAALVLATRRRPGPGSPALPTGRRLRRTAAAWGVLVLLGGAWELAAWLRPLAGRTGRLGLVPPGELLDALRSRLPIRLAIVLGWAWLGSQFLAR